MVMRLAKGVAALLTGQAQDGRTFSVDVYQPISFFVYVY